MEVIRLHRQRSGYLIVKRPGPLLALFEASEASRSHPGRAEYLKALTKAFSFVNPRQYRGISRYPLPPIEPEPPETFNAGLDESSLRAACTRMWELTKDGTWFLQSPDHARAVFNLLENKEDYEIILVRLDPFERTGRTLGYDIGFWYPDWSSVICDCAVLPTWHPPARRDFAKVARHLK